MNTLIGEKMAEKEVVQKNDGVEIIVPESADADDINEVIRSCSSGENSCSCCSSDFLSENKVGVYELNGHEVIKIMGNVKKDEIEKKINSCSCFDK
ncbi:MAG: hypothetical protein B2I18_00070 [Cuniculiplasma sp. C_DKE]|jgi:hypothetical protein|nr:MAG: hypothetical protein B2I18_07935 [Cuniculiplasma sp. C_DKE]OWP55586.1 MAG: hypothetical protein B2I18_00070 [Cuniculiplasma sp. C_DKE]